VPKAIACFGEALASRKQIVVDFSETRAADARFFGLLLMLRKQLKGRGAAPQDSAMNLSDADIERRSQMAHRLRHGPFDTSLG
jgi:hypothetical protein